MRLRAGQGQQRANKQSSFVGFLGADKSMLLWVISGRIYSYSSDTAEGPGASAEKLTASLKPGLTPHPPVPAFLSSSVLPHHPIPQLLASPVFPTILISLLLTVVPHSHNTYKNVV